MEGPAASSMGTKGTVGAGVSAGSAGEVVFGLELDVGGTRAAGDRVGAGSEDAGTTFGVAGDSDGLAIPVSRLEPELRSE